MRTEWQRSSPVAAVYFLVRNLRGLINLWPAVAGTLVVEEWRGPFFVVVLPLALVLLVLVSALQWWFFGFRYDDRQIQLRSGVLSRRQLTLDFDRVQEMNLEQALYYRPFGLWSLDLDSAGSHSKEAHIPGLRRHRAEDIRDRFLHFKRDTAGSTEQAQEAQAVADYRLSLGVGELARFGLMRNTLLYVVPVVGGVLSQSSTLMQSLGDWLQSLPWLRWLSEFVTFQERPVQVALALAVFGVLLALMYALSVGFALVKYGGYRLAVEGDRFQYSAGLLNREQRGFKRHKLQCMVVRQGLFARWLGRYSLYFQQANDPADSDRGLAGGFLVPVVDAPALRRLKTLLALEERPWRATQPVRIAWNTLSYGSIAFIAALLAARTSTTIAAWHALAVYPLALLVFWARWRKTRFFVGDRWLAVQTGLIGYRISYIPVSKVQKLQLAEGPLSRWHRAAELTVWSGSKAVSVGFVAKPVLSRAYHRLLRRVRVHKGRWI